MELSVGPVDPRSVEAVDLVTCYGAEVIFVVGDSAPLRTALRPAQAMFCVHGGAFFVARTVPDGEPVGCVGVRRLSPGVAELDRLWVDVRARRVGAGARLVRAAEAFAAFSGARTMVLQTRHELVDAIRLYEALGWRHRPRYGSNPMADVWMTTPLEAQTSSSCS